MSTTVTRPVTICGGLPVMATVHFSYDEYTMEHDAEVEALCWIKRDGTAGKPVSQKVWDRAEKHDYLLCGVIEQVNDQLAYETYGPGDKLMELLP